MSGTTPTRFRNTSVSREMLDLTIPDKLLATADEVID